MENQKKGTGKTVMIIILILLVIGLGGYIAYDKITNKDENKNLQNEVKRLSTEITTLKEEQANIQNQKSQESVKTEQTNNSFINAVYYGYSDENGVQSNSYLILFNDGNFINSHVRSHTQNGTYTISNGNIVLNYSGDNPAAGQSEPTSITANISSDFRTITYSNGFQISKIN